MASKTCYEINYGVRLRDNSIIRNQESCSNKKEADKIMAQLAKRNDVILYSVMLTDQMDVTDSIRTWANVTGWLVQSLKIKNIKFSYPKF